MVMARGPACSRLLAGCIAGALLTFGIGGEALAQASAAKNWKPPRTSDGTPDLQGVWTSATLTRLERDDKFGTRLVLTEAEVFAIEHAEQQYVANAAKPTDLSKEQSKCGVNLEFGCGYNNFWIDRGSKVIEINGEKRSSLLIDPIDGKVPPLTASRRQELAKQRAGRGRYDGPETLTLAERCLLSFGSSSGPPMLPVLYNNHYQIVQTKDAVLIQVEMVHDARIVRMGGKHGSGAVKKWMGDSVGRWDGDTLIVETTNFNEQQSFRGSTPTMKVTERFARTAADTILYRFTVDDPAAFTKTFTGEVPFYLTSEPIYEYACHEGNYALPGILAGGRVNDKAPEGDDDRGE
jgi:hypothetical protein